jgi:hypothetical protein
MSILDQIDSALSGGSKAAFNAESPVGTVVTGEIVDVDYRQVTDFTTQQPATFPSGDPKMQFIIRVQTTQRSDGDDDGIRSVYIPAWGKRKAALAEAIRASGAAKGSEVMVPGVGFTATYNGEKRGEGGPSGSYTYKEYAYSFNRGQAASSAADALTQQAPAAQQSAPASDLPAGFDATTWAGLPEETKNAIRSAQS